MANSTYPNTLALLKYPRTGMLSFILFYTDKAENIKKEVHQS
jgi:hypothetical protein